MLDERNEFVTVLGCLDTYALPKDKDEFEMHGQTWYKIPVGWRHMQFPMLVPDLDDKTMWRICATLCSLSSTPEAEA